MKIKLYIALILLLFLFSCGAKKSTKSEAMNKLQTTEFWYTDYKEGLKIAKKEEKKILLYFGGSNWCPPCIKLRKDIFETDLFKNNIKKEYILIDIDFIMGGDQEEDLKKQNRELAGRYNINNYPTLFILNKDGVVIEKISGYGGVLKNKYLKTLGLK